MTKKPQPPKGKVAGQKPAKRPAKTTKAKPKAKTTPPKPAKSKAAKGQAAAKGKPAPKRPAKRTASRPPPPPPKYAHVFDNPRNVKRAIYVLFTLCGITFVLDLFVHRHVDHPWEAMFGFYAIYGFTACVLLVLAANEMRKVLMRREDYYDD